ncbi:ABC transporter permease [Roseicyclus sp. F158]|uniref:ABC transporter permease n=1 Tax=Tropicimonas omnivorans TaxID=3075590 RepID=A0ABU3DL87_9RHOB|nr:ABC transporter permease [Roseicyclus sp. F158]MDT0684476.1 ABC transporter permease [Roseicyclus sp. F158]
MSALDAGGTPSRGRGFLPRRRTAARHQRPSLLVKICFAWLALVLFVAIFAGWLAPFGYTEQSLLTRLKPPAFLGGPAEHILGTDGLGRDVLSRLFFAVRTSILIAFLGTAIGAVTGTVLGIIAAHFRGWVDDIVMVLVDFQASVPFLIVALAILAFFGNSFVLFVCIVGLFGWETYARLVRGLVLSVSGEGYAFAIRTLGVHPARIYLRHVLPNIAGVLTVQLTLNFPEIILLETSLSFLGLGVQPPGTSLGLALGEGRNYIATAWWIGLPAGAVIFLTTLSISLVGDWVRDALDPSLSRAE